MQMQKLVDRRLNRLLGALDRAADTAREDASVEAVHSLRVATRRLSQNLRTFSAFVPEDGGKKVRKRLRGLRDIAADLRSRDIARQQLQAAGVALDGPLAQKLSHERDGAARRLSKELANWSKKGYPKRWRTTLRTKG